MTEWRFGYRLDGDDAPRTQNFMLNTPAARSTGDFPSIRQRMVFRSPCVCVLRYAPDQVTHRGMGMFEELQRAEQARDFESVIAGVREAVLADRRVFADPWLKAWSGRRWRNIFISEAAADEAAVSSARKKGLRKDVRPPRQQVAERYLRGDAIREWSVEMPAAAIPDLHNCTGLFCPGLLNGLLPTRAFQEALPALQSAHDWRFLRADLHAMRSCEANLADLDAAMRDGRGLRADCQRIDASQALPPGDVYMIGYSKGVPDILTWLAARQPAPGRVRCLFNWAGAPGGSYLADDIYNSVKDLEIARAEDAINRLLQVISPFIRMDRSPGRLDEFDIKGALRDLTTTARATFMQQQATTLDDLDIPVFNLSGATSLTEVPYFQIQGYMEISKYDANNDMQVTQAQAKVDLPLAVDLAMLRGHHWDLSYSPFPRTMRLGSPNLDHPFPKQAAASAMVKFAAELGLID